MENKKILLVVAHPDDETVCAGTLIKQIENRRQPFVGLQIFRRYKAGNRRWKHQYG